MGWVGSGHDFLIKQLVRFGWVSKIGPTAMSEPTAVQRVHHHSLESNLDVISEDGWIKEPQNYHVGHVRCIMLLAEL